MAANAFESYQKAWELYKANWKLYALAGFLVLVLSLVVAIPFSAFHILVLLWVLPSTAMNPLIPPLVIAADIVLLLVTVFVSGTLKGALFGVCYDVVQGEKISARRLFHWARVRWQTYVGITLIQLIAVFIVLAPFMIAAVFIAGATGIHLLAVPVILLSIPFILLVAGVTELAFPKTAAEFTGTVESLSGAVRLVLANPAQFILLAVVMIVLTCIGIIPLVGSLVITPLNSTAFTIFYMAEKKPKRKR